MIKKKLYNASGITVKKLKVFINQLPEKDTITGKEYVIWLELYNILHNGNVCTTLELVNTGDILFSNE